MKQSCLLFALTFGVCPLIACSANTNKGQNTDGGPLEVIDASEEDIDASPDATTALRGYACEEVAVAPGDGIFSLRAFGGKLYAGQFGYGQAGVSMLWQYPDWQRSAPGILGVGESVCALAEFGGALYANTENSGDIYRSTDGDNWTLVHNGESGVIGCGLEVFGDALYAVNYNFDTQRDGKILRTTDGQNFSDVWTGANWSPYLREITSHEGVLYAYGTNTATDQGFWLSSTDGNAWALAETPSRFIRGVSWKGALYSGATDFSSNGQAGIYRTEGPTTSLVYQSPKHYVTELKEWDNSLFAATSSGWKEATGQSSLLMSRDGTDWITVCDFPETAAWSVEVFDGHLYVGTWHFGQKGKLYKVNFDPDGPGSESDNATLR